MRELAFFILLVAVVALGWDDKRQRDGLNDAQVQIQDLTSQRDQLAAAAAAEKSTGPYGTPQAGAPQAGSPQANRGGLPLWFQERLENSGSQDLAPKSH